MKLRSILISAIILVLLLAIFGAFLIHYGVPGTAPERIVGITVGQIAFRDADDHLLVLDHPGTLYLIDFVALGCEGCMRELPGLTTLPEEIGASGDFQLVLVHGLGLRGQALRTVAEQFKIGSFPLYGDTEQVADLLGVKGWPTKFLVRDGHLLYRQFGYILGDHRRWRRIISQEIQAGRRRPTSAST